MAIFLLPTFTTLYVIISEYLCFTYRNNIWASKMAQWIEALVA